MIEKYEQNSGSRTNRVETCPHVYSCAAIVRGQTRKWMDVNVITGIFAIAWSFSIYPIYITVLSSIRTWEREQSGLSIDTCDSRADFSKLPRFRPKRSNENTQNHWKNSWIRITITRFPGSWREDLWLQRIHKWRSVYIYIYISITSKNQGEWKEGSPRFR